MMDKHDAPDLLHLTIKRLATTLTLAITVASIACSSAQAVPTATNQDAPGLADTPGNRTSVSTADKTLTEGSLKFQDGLALLDSPPLLKVYYYAYSGAPVDYSGILTENTDNIVKPLPVQASDDQKKVIDRLIQIAKSHPEILIKVDDIALEPYDKERLSFPVVNRLFMKSARFYFDNSPYHYYYADASAFSSLRCTDRKLIATMNSSVASYAHFSMDIVGRVAHGTAKDNALTIDLRKVRLKDSSGKLLITQTRR
jgi:hypothetical protein